MMDRILKVAKGIIYRDKMFLLQLRDNKPEIIYPNQWSFLGGGIEENETPWEALKREIKEELQWEPEKGDFLYNWNNPEETSQIHFYAIPFTGNSEKLVLHEGQSLGWFNLSQVKNMDSVVFHVVEHLTYASSFLETKISS